MFNFVLNKSYTILLILAIAFIAPSSTYANFAPVSDLESIVPCSAKVGESLELSITGSHLDDIKSLQFSDSRITATPVAPDIYFPNGQANRFKLTIPADVTPGIVEVRALGRFGLSTARALYVSPAGSIEHHKSDKNHNQKTAMSLKVGAAVSSVCSEKKVDWYSFSVKKGERLLLQVWAERLFSKADCVLTLLDSEGRILKKSQLHFGADPLIDFTPKADGQYFVTVADILFRGGPRYGYRFALSAGPHIDSIYPAAGEPGKKQRFTIYGRNLPGGKKTEFRSIDNQPLESLEIDIQVPSKPKQNYAVFSGTPRQGILPTFNFSYKGSNKFRIGLATEPILLEKNDNSKQTISVPAEINGRFDQAGDEDCYRFSVAKNQTICLESISNQQQFKTDTSLIVERVTIINGKEELVKVATNDDPTSFYGTYLLDDINADTTDAVLSFTADKAGQYQCTIINHRGGGPQAQYRLAVRTAQPDFQLLACSLRPKKSKKWAEPGINTLRRGDSVIYRILVIRKDGFSGDITVTANNLPEGLSSHPLAIRGDSCEGYLTIKSDIKAKNWSGSILIKGHTTIAGKKITRQAKGSNLVWKEKVEKYQAQVRSRMNSEIMLSVIDTDTAPVQIEVEDKTWTVELNQSLEIPVKVIDQGSRNDKLSIEPHGLAGIIEKPPTVSIEKDEKTAKLKIDFKKSENFNPKPGNYQFVIRGICSANTELYKKRADAAKKEVDRLKELEKTFNNKTGEAKKQVKDIQNKLKSVSSKGDPATQKQSTEKLEKELIAANTNAKDSQTHLNRVRQLKKEAENSERQIKRASNKKSHEFATYSFPIHVEVIPLLVAKDDKK